MGDTRMTLSEYLASAAAVLMVAGLVFVLAKCIVKAQELLDE